MLDAAVRAFARRGFSGLTMDDLAREAGYSTASLYNYFPNKDAVLCALVDRSLERMLRAVEGPLPLGLSPVQRLESIVLRLLEEAREHLWLTELLMSHAMASGEADPGSVASSYLAVHQRFMDAVTGFVGQVDWMPGDHAERLAYHLVSAVRTENFLWLVQDPPEDLAALAHELMAFWSGGARALVTAGFIFYHIPGLDSYLAQRYGDEFVAYSQRTKKLIPWVY